MDQSVTFRKRVYTFTLKVYYNSILNKAYPNLDFGIKIVDTFWKLSEIYYSEVEHLKFYKSNFGDSWVCEPMRIIWGLLEIVDSHKKGG